MKECVQIRMFLLSGLGYGAAVEHLYIGPGRAESASRAVALVWVRWWALERAPRVPEVARMWHA